MYIFMTIFKHILVRTVNTKFEKLKKKSSKFEKQIEQLRLGWSARYNVLQYCDEFYHDTSVMNNYHMFDVSDMVCC